jgi:hypothetical protein
VKTKREQAPTDTTLADDLILGAAPIAEFMCGAADKKNQRRIYHQSELDPARGAAEYLAQFRSDIESFISREIVDAAVAVGRHELPRASNVTYRGFVDPSGGSGTDSMTLAIAHRDRPLGVVLDLVRERRPPFSPEQVAGEFAVVSHGRYITFPVARSARARVSGYEGHMR